MSDDITPLLMLMVDPRVLIVLLPLIILFYGLALLFPAKTTETDEEKSKRLKKAYVFLAIPIAILIGVSGYYYFKK